MPGRQSVTAAVAAAALSLALIGSIAYAAVPQEVPCTLDGRALTCTLPEVQASTVTQTVTKTVTAVPIPTSTLAPPTTTVSSSTPAPVNGAWWSGQSSTRTTLDGSFAAWRGRPVEVGGTWSARADEFDAPNWQLGAKYAGQENRAAYAGIARVDYALEPFKAGENWGQAASGAFDARWTQHLQALKAAWGSRDPAGLYVRFAWEFNGNWFAWSVGAGDIANFKTAWARFGALVRQQIPGAQIVWCPNWGSNGSYDDRTTYPGGQYVDVVAIDFYNNWPWANTTGQLDQKWNLTGPGGDPAGPESWRKFAEAQGKPFALPEWSNDSGGGDASGGGDSPLFMQYMNSWLTANGSRTPQPGKVLYEVLFNVPGYADRYSLFPIAQEPGNDAAAAKYAELW